MDWEKLSQEPWTSYDSLSSIVFANGGFYASSSSGSYLRYSSDGIIFTNVGNTVLSPPLRYFDNHIFGSGGVYNIESKTVVSKSGLDSSTLCFDGNKYIYIQGQSSDKVSFLSKDLLQQWSITIKAGISFVNVNYLNGKYYAICANGGFYTSEDCESWNFVYLPNVGALFDICYGNGTYILITAKGIYNSTDAITWQLGYNTSLYSYGYRVQFVNGFFIWQYAYGYTLVSTDGKQWVPLDRALSSFTYTGNRIYAIFDSKVYRSNMLPNISEDPVVSISVEPCLKIEGIPGLTYVVEYSTNATTWYLKDYITLPSTPYKYIVNDAFKNCYYRILRKQ